MLGRFQILLGCRYGPTSQRQPRFNCCEITNFSLNIYIYIYIASGPVAIMPPRTKAGDPEPSAKKTLTGWHVLAGSPHEEVCV